MAGAQQLQFGHGVEAVENRSGPSRRRRASESFNSATALKPWRTSRTHQEGEGGVSFNSARALKPWRTWYAAQRLDGASQLQFGHGVEAVENTLLLLAGVPKAPPFNSAT